MWVADVLDSKGIPYIGSNSQTMKDMIDKFKTHETLASRGVAGPGAPSRADDRRRVDDPLPRVREADGRVAVGGHQRRQRREQRRRAAGARWRGSSASSSRPRSSRTSCPATSSPRSSSATAPTRQCLPGLVSVEAKHYGKHKVLRADLRGVGPHEDQPSARARRRGGGPGRRRPPTRCAASITCASTSRPTRRARCASWK